MNENLKDGTAKASARRRLIRGVFAAPAALTLYSGSVAASSASCLVGQVNNPPSPLPEELSEQDTWLRVQLYTVGKESGLSTWVKGEDVVALAKPLNSVYLARDEWQCFKAGNDTSNTSGYTVNQRLPNLTQQEPSATDGDGLLQNGNWVAVRVDEYGNIKGVVGIDTGAGGSTVSGSCWASFQGPDAA